MLDIKFMRENAEAVLAAMEALGATDAPVTEALTLDERRRADPDAGSRCCGPSGTRARSRSGN